MFRKVEMSKTCAGQQESTVKELDKVLPSVDITEDNGIWHFYIKDGFPHRIKTENGAYKYLYDRRAIHVGYLAAAETVGEHIFNEKVMLYIVTHSKDTDHDNLDTKLFIDDCIKMPFLRDDSPDCISVMMDYELSNDAGADAWLGEELRILDMIKERKIALRQEIRS